MEVKKLSMAVVGIILSVVMVAAFFPAISESTEEGTHPAYFNATGNATEVTESTVINYTYNASTYTHTYTVDGVVVALPNMNAPLVCTSSMCLKAYVASTTGSNYLSYCATQAKNIDNITSATITLTPTAATVVYSTASVTNTSVSLTDTWGYYYSGTGTKVICFNDSNEYFYSSASDVRGFMMNGTLGGTVSVTGTTATFVDYYGTPASVSIEANEVESESGLVKIKMSTSDGFEITKGTNSVTLNMFVIDSSAHGTVENASSISSFVSVIMLVIVVGIVLSAVAVFVIRRD